MNHDVRKAPTRQEALRDLFAVWQFQPETEYVKTEDSLDRVTAEDITAVNTIPSMRISAMDGYAVKSENFADGNPDVSKWVLNVDFAPADTGDDFPDAFDSVIAVEQLHYDENGVLTLADGYEFKKGSSIRPAGCMMKPGDLLVRKNTRITPELRANLQAGGVTVVPVVRRPVVAFIPTGSELTPAGTEPLRGQNVETNSGMISAYLQRWGAEAVCLPIVRDDPVLLERAMDGALKFADIVLLNGGSSKGTEDFNSLMLERRGSYFTHTVRTVPGRPVGISIVDGKPVINLPGPVMAAWVVSDWLLYPMVCRWLGLPTVKRNTVSAMLTEDLRKGPPVEVYTRVRLEKRGGICYATPLSRGVRNSEMLRDGIGVLIAPVGEFGWVKGQSVDVELLVDEALIPVSEEAAEIALPANCTQCENHCPTDALKCGRGRAYLSRLKNGEIFHSGCESADLLGECADTLRHMEKMVKLHGGDPESLLDGLTEEEHMQLIALLKKQQQKWNADHAKRHAAGKGGPHHP